GLVREGRAHEAAVVVVARDRDEPNGERREQPHEMVVLVLERRIHQIAGDHHQVGRGGQPVELGDAARERDGGVDLAVGQRSGPGDVQIGDLRDDDRADAQVGPPGRRRTAAGSTASPTRSPGLTSIEFGASTRIGLGAAPLTVSRCRSPMKLTASTLPVRLAPSGAATAIDSGRIMATTGPAAAPFARGSRPPGSASAPATHSASTMLAAPMNSATKRLVGAKEASRGVAVCAIAPRRIATMRSPRPMASARS